MHCENVKLCVAGAYWLKSYFQIKTLTPFCQECQRKRNCPSRNYEKDCKVVAQVLADLFRLDAGREVKENYETNLLRNDGRPLAFFNDKSMYSKLGMFIWMDFWVAGANFGPISKVLHASDRTAIEDLAEEKFVL